MSTEKQQRPQQPARTRRKPQEQPAVPKKSRRLTCCGSRRPAGFCPKWPPMGYEISNAEIIAQKAAGDHGHQRETRETDNKSSKTKRRRESGKSALTRQTFYGSGASRSLKPSSGAAVTHLPSTWSTRWRPGASAQPSSANEIGLQGGNTVDGAPRPFRLRRARADRWSLGNRTKHPLPAPVVHSLTKNTRSRIVETAVHDKRDTLLYVGDMKSAHKR